MKAIEMKVVVNRSEPSKTKVVIIALQQIVNLREVKIDGTDKDYTEVRDIAGETFLAEGKPRDFMVTPGPRPSLLKGNE